MRKLFVLLFFSILIVQNSFSMVEFNPVLDHLGVGIYNPSQYKMLRELCRFQVDSGQMMQSLPEKVRKELLSKIPKNVSIESNILVLRKPDRMGQVYNIVFHPYAKKWFSSNPHGPKLDFTYNVNMGLFDGYGIKEVGGNERISLNRFVVQSVNPHGGYKSGNDILYTHYSPDNAKFLVEKDKTVSTFLAIAISPVINKKVYCVIDYVIILVLDNKQAWECFGYCESPELLSENLNRLSRLFAGNDALALDAASGVIMRTLEKKVHLEHKIYLKDYNVLIKGLEKAVDENKNIKIAFQNLINNVRNDPELKNLPYVRFHLANCIGKIFDKNISEGEVKEIATGNETLIKFLTGIQVKL
jgi:hypothetical protein